MHVSAVTWALTLALILGILAVDLLVVSRRASRPTIRQAALAVCIYVGLAVLFGLWVDARRGGRGYFDRRGRLARQPEGSRTAG